MNTPLGGGELVNTGACEVTTPLVKAKFVLIVPTRAAIENEPAAPLAVKNGAVATPDAFVMARALLRPPAKRPDAPLAAALNVTTRPGNGWFPASATSTVIAVAYAVLSGALCGVPDCAVIVAGKLVALSATATLLT